MANINSPLFDDCRDWIKKARKNKKSWEEIKYALRNNSNELEEFLERQKNDNFWPEDLDVSTWHKIVNSEKVTENKSEEIKTKEEKTILIDETQDSEVEIPQNNKSSWQLYKKHLLDSGFKKKSVDEIESSTIRILKRLNRDTRDTGAIKGLVIGHVQSGKTANMAALMAMAADWGWNFFVVLSGVIENLRKQTQKRLLRDLNRPGNLNWESREQLSKNCPLDKRLQELRLEDDSRNRYFTVCLKNYKRLVDLIEWLHTDKNKLRQIKMLIIDDEADQASINSADVSTDDRTRIVEGKNIKNEITDAKPKAINYISYTATPYANFLNESSTESLYPKNFIRALEPSKEYFGPKEIFGIEGSDKFDGMNIIRIIDHKDLYEFKKMHNSETSELPNSFKKSILWFLCGAAAMRYWGYKKPISMLVHTSQRQKHHEIVSNKIMTWLKKTDKNILLKLCKDIWHYETKEFTKEDLRNSYNEYGRDDDEINNYPEFDDIHNNILDLIKDITHIPLGDEGDLEYKNHLHLCVDNCSNNGINDEGMHVRLAYPELNSNNYPEKAPAFIIVGGSTLSRGLTLEGLISTYFFRTSYQADSLMQMGRWFGYRKSYELIPRIWMTEDTYDKFIFLSTLEDELREDIHRYMVAGAKPTDYGPRVKNTPKVSWLRVTAKNRMQSAEEIDIDYTGTSTQTILFENNETVLKKNIHTVERFIGNIDSFEESDLESAFVARNIDFKIIKKEIFDKFEFHRRARVFNEIDVFSKWVLGLNKEEKLKKWNVIVAGNGKVNSSDIDNPWKLNIGSIGKVNRSRKKLKNQKEETINIGALRAPIDLLADLKINELSYEYQEKIKHNISNREIENIRKESGIEDIPQLIIYRIDKNSEPRKNSKTRKSLNAVEDIIGLCITLPGVNRNRLAKTLTIKLDGREVKDEWGGNE
jgi:hypothetical protein